MNVKVITTALQHLVGGAALNVALGARLELATQEAIAASGREAIIVYPKLPGMHLVPEHPRGQGQT